LELGWGEEIMDAITGEIALMATAAGKAFLILMEPTRLMYLAAGCLMGLVLGIVPGIGGLAGTAMLLPFTFNMDPYAAFALLLGLGSTTTTGDPIPAVLFGVPGGAASAATVLDGFPMAKKGEAGRALSASYMSSMMGGIFGACLLAISIPILRPVMLFLGSPELLAFAVLGISMVAILSGNAPLRGLAAGCLGIMIAMIGTDPQSGTLRWTFNSLYLWDGLPLTPLLLGIFALPELCDLLITRQAIAQGFEKADIYKGQWQGVKDCMQHWWLIVRCSWIGGGIGSIPGISASVVDWLAYGHALKTEKGAAQTFGKGDVRGVIASESSNNAKEGGALVPTIAFGVPGSATMAILLGAFLIHGLVPGPDMLHKNLDITYSMVWSVALANILGAGMCYLFSPQFARLATLRFSLILPAVMGIIYIGAFEATRQWGDLFALLFFGLVGWFMKQFKWPRPPLILGAVLGDTIERYLFISVERYGISWFARPVVAILFIMAGIGLLRPLVQDIKSQGGVIKLAQSFQAPRFHATQLFSLFMLAILSSMVIMATAWDFSAKIVPLVVGSVGITVCVLSLFNDMCRKPTVHASESLAQSAQHEVEQKIHMDLASDTEHLPISVIAKRAARFFGYLIAFMGVMAVIGLVPTVALFVVVFMRYENKEPWKLVISYAIVLVFAISFVFDNVMSIPWPPTLIAQWFPALKFLPSI
jgi:TctA family transporter